MHRKHEIGHYVAEMQSSRTLHIPVLQTTVMNVFQPKHGETVLDVTLGLGGHAHTFLESVGEAGRLIGLDADQRNLEVARKNLSEFSDRTTLMHANFSQLSELNLPRVDILFADLGLSSPHLDDPARGFSFRSDGPLDLRFDQSRGVTAMHLIEMSDEAELATIFRSYGELYMQARRLASTLAGTQIATTAQLRTLIEELFGFRAKAILPLVFQALRIAVNDELTALDALLHVGPSLLKKGGRMGIISYHSLEDRPVKHTFRSLTTPLKDPITGKISQDAAFRLLTPKALVPSAQEMADNPRSRSAKFRALQFRL